MPSELQRQVLEFNEFGLIHTDQFVKPHRNSKATEKYSKDEHRRNMPCEARSKMYKVFLRRPLVALSCTVPTFLMQRNVRGFALRDPRYNGRGRPFHREG